MLRISSAIWVIGGSAASAAITLIAIRIIGEAIGPEAFGRSILLYGIVLLLVSLTSGPIAQAVGRYYFDAAGPKHCETLFASALCLGLLGVGVSGGVLGLLKLSNWILSYFELVLLMIAVVLESLRVLHTSWLNAEQAFSYIGLSQLLDAAARPVFVVVLAWHGFDPILALLGGYAAGSCLALCVLMPPVYRKIAIQPPSLKDLNRIRRYGQPLVFNGLFGWLSSNADRYVVATVLDAAPLGVYVAGTALGGRVALLIGNIAETLFRPHLYMAVARDEKTCLLQVIKQWAIAVGAGGGFVGFALLFYSDIIVEIALPISFRENAKMVLGAGFASFWLVALVFIPIRLLYAYERTGLVAIVELAGSFFLILGVLLLGRWLGIAGACLALVLAAALKGFVAVSAAWRAGSSSTYGVSAPPQEGSRP